MEWLGPSAEVLVGIVLVIAILACLIIIPFGLPGTWLLLAVAGIYGWATGFTAVSTTNLLVMTGLAGAGELLELAATALVGGDDPPSGRTRVLAVLGAVIGGILGAPFFFGLGALGGALLGAFGAATSSSLFEARGIGRSVRHGFGAVQGRLLGLVFKLAVAVAMVIVLI